MVETGYNGQRVYVTNSLYGAWSDQFYHRGIGAWMAKLDADTEAGGLSVDEDFVLYGAAKGKRSLGGVVGLIR